ncbi:MAG: ABC transporter permease [Treponema sp.]|nr:ABC transporter permease [Treponema sp.]
MKNSASSVFFIAFRYLLGRAKEGGRYLRGAVAGIALSLIPIVVTLIVADGMIRGITDRFIELGTSHLQAYNFNDAEDLDSIIEKLPLVDGVTGHWKERQSLGILHGKDGKTGVNIRAVEPSFWEDEGSKQYLEVLDGSSILETDREILLGTALAQNLGIKVGDTVRLMTVRVTSTGNNIPRLTPLTVKGIVSSGYRELDASWCLMTYSMGTQILPADMSNNHLLIKIDDAYENADRISAALVSLFGPRHWVYTWKELQRSQYSSYESTRQILLFIMALIVMVAAVNVSSAASMLALERQKDIAVLKAFGTSPKSTSGIFLSASLLTGIFGSIFGITLGLIIGRFINQIIRGIEWFLGIVSSIFGGGTVTILDPEYYLEEIPIIIDWKAIAAIFFFTVLCSVIASWIPSRRAGKISPTELLRKN